MVRLITAALILPVIFLTTQTARSETIDTRLQWPRVLKESFGNPQIKILSSTDEASPAVIFLRPARTAFVVSKPNCRAWRSTCTSSGTNNCEGFMRFQSPKSTPRSSLLTIQRRNMFNRLQVLFVAGEGMCFRVRFGAMGREKNRSRKPLSPASVCMSSSVIFSKKASSNDAWS